MSDRSPGPASIRVHLTAVIVATSALLLSVFPASGEWTRFHGDAANSGFVDLVTNPAGAGSLSVPGLGTFAPGAGPVIGPDGAVYLGTEQGKLIQLNRNGASSWTSELPQIFGGRPSIVASPAVGADGSIYVIGVLTLREHKAGTTVIRHISEVHKFSPGGQHLWRTPLPARELGRGGNASAPPNIWQSSGTEAVMVPAIFALGVTRLFALSTDGVILAETVVSRTTTNSVGGIDCGPPFCFSAPPVLRPADPADRLPNKVRLPAPGPAVVQVSAGPPLVILADPFHDVVGYIFSPTAGFTEKFRARDPARLMRSSPMLLLSGHTAVGTARAVAGDIVFSGPSASKLGPAHASGMGPILSTPTRLADDRFVVVDVPIVDNTGTAISVLKRVPVAVPPPIRIVSRTFLPGESIAAAAASRTHVFVSTASAFHTFDSRTVTEVSRFSWLGGGVSPPAIGVDGSVYAIASNILFVFPPPLNP